MLRNMSTKNARTLGIRLDEKTNARLVKFEEATLIEGVSLARAALIAALDSFEANQSLTLPLKIVSATQEPFVRDYVKTLDAVAFKTRPHSFNEPSAEYEAKPPIKPRR